MRTPHEEAMAVFIDHRLDICGREHPQPCPSAVAAAIENARVDGAAAVLADCHAHAFVWSTVATYALRAARTLTVDAAVLLERTKGQFG